MDGQMELNRCPKCGGDLIYHETGESPYGTLLQSWRCARCCGTWQHRQGRCYAVWCPDPLTAGAGR